MAMQNPFRSEADAYRFLLIGVAYFAAIVAAKLLFGMWVALFVFALLSVGAVYWILRGGKREAPMRISARPHLEGERRILVIANETVGGEALRDVIAQRAEGVSEDVLVVCPALNSPVRHWTSDEDTARAAAQERLDRSLARLNSLGIAARGEVGDGEPLQAIEDAVRTFGPDEIVISTHPVGRSHWLEKGVVSGARERFDVPITHVVVDLVAERDDAG